jgi:hypothetical protein
VLVVLLTALHLLMVLLLLCWSQHWSAVETCLEAAASTKETPALPPPLLLLLLVVVPCPALQVQWLLLVLSLPMLQSGRQVHRCRRLKRLQQCQDLHARPCLLGSSTDLFLLLLLLQALLSYHILAMQA